MPAERKTHFASVLFPLSSRNFLMVWKVGGFFRPCLRGSLMSHQGAQMELDLVLHSPGRGCLPLTPPASGLEYALQCSGASVLLIYFQVYVIVLFSFVWFYMPVVHPYFHAWSARRGPPKMSTRICVSENMDIICKHFSDHLCWSSGHTGLLTAPGQVLALWERSGCMP